ncbi:hypothetical protein SHIRM173S_01336 [Streptomyces hirsutus]
MSIVREPQVFLMDEPLSNLDAKLRVSTRTQIASLQRRLGITTVYVTHDQVEALTMGDRVAVLKDGLLQQVDTAAQHVRQARQPLRRRLHRLPGHEPRRGPDRRRRREVRQLAWSRCSRDALAAATDKGDRTVTVGVRPEHFDVVELNGGAAASLTKDSADAPAGLAVSVNVVEEGPGADALRLRHRRGRRRDQGPRRPRRRPRRCRRRAATAPRRAAARRERTSSRPPLPRRGDHERTTFPRLAREHRLAGFPIPQGSYWRAIDTAKDLTEAARVTGGSRRPPERPAAP